MTTRERSNIHSIRNSQTHRKHGIQQKSIQHTQHTQQQHIHRAHSMRSMHNCSIHSIRTTAPHTHTHTDTPFSTTARGNIHSMRSSIQHKSNNDNDDDDDNNNNSRRAREGMGKKGRGAREGEGGRDEGVADRPWTEREGGEG